jgi:hypothetical protein
VVETKEPTAGHWKICWWQVDLKINLAHKLPTVHRISKSLHIPNSSSLITGGFVCAWSTYFWSPFACLRQSQPVWGYFHLYSHAGCACLSLADLRFPGQLLRLRLPSPVSRHDLGRPRMPAPAVHKIVFGLLFWVVCWCMYVDERVVEKSAFYSNYAETLVDWFKVFNHFGKAAGIYIITIARKCLLFCLQPLILTYVPQKYCIAFSSLRLKTLSSTWS